MLAGQSHGKGNSELVGCSHITLPLPPKKRTLVLKHAGKRILQPELEVRRARVAGVAYATGALWDLTGELLVLVVVLCQVSSKIYAGLTWSADMVICLPCQ